MMREETARPDEIVIAENAAALARCTAEMMAAKAKVESLKVFFERLATADLQDTKRKTVEYWGTGNEKIVVGNSETVKPISMTMIKRLLGDAFPDFVKEEVTYKMTEPCKRLFAAAFLGNYTEGSLDKTIEAITSDEKIQKTLRKKLKGRYQKDTETLIRAAGLSEQEASDWAYLAAEVINWEWILQVLKAAGWQGTVQEAIDIIRAAIIVDEGIKVTVEAKES